MWNPAPPVPTTGRWSHCPLFSGVRSDNTVREGSFVYEYVNGYETGAVHNGTDMGGDGAVGTGMGT